MVNPILYKMLSRPPPLRTVLSRTPKGREMLLSYYSGMKPPEGFIGPVAPLSGESQSDYAKRISYYSTGSYDWGTSAPSIERPDIESRPPGYDPPTKPFTEKEFYAQDWSSPDWRPHPLSEPKTFDVRNFEQTLISKTSHAGKQIEIYKLTAPQVKGGYHLHGIKVGNEWHTDWNLDQAKTAVAGLTQDIPFGQALYVGKEKGEKNATREAKKWKSLGYDVVKEIVQRSDGSYAYRIRVYQKGDRPADIPTKIQDIDPDYEFKVSVPTAAIQIDDSNLKNTPGIMTVDAPAVNVKNLGLISDNRGSGVDYSYTGVPELMPHTTPGALAKAEKEMKMGLLDEVKPSGKTFGRGGYESQTYIPGQTLLERAERIQKSSPLYQSHVKWSKIRAQEMKEQAMEFELKEKHFVGIDPSTGEKLYERKSPHLVKFGYMPGDPDYAKHIGETGSLTEQIKAQTTGIDTLKTNIQLSKEALPEARTSLQTIKAAPRGTMFYVDEDKDGVWDTTASGEPIMISKEALMHKYPELIKQLETNISYEQKIPEYEKDLESLKNLKGIISSYEDLGYEMSYKEDEGYEFETPKSSKVYDWYYGTEWHSVIPKVGAGWMEGFWIPSGAAAIQSWVDPKSGAWEAKQEQLAGKGMDYAFQINVMGSSDDYWGKEVFASEAMQTIAVFAATAGLGYVATGAGKAIGAGLSGKLGTIGSKFTPTGAKILSGGAKIAKTTIKPFTTVGKPLLRLAGTKGGRIITGFAAFGMLEGPGLYKVHQEQPEMFGSELSKAGIRWIVPYAGFKAGSKAYTISHQFKQTGDAIQHMAVKSDIYVEPMDDLVDSSFYLYDDESYKITNINKTNIHMRSVKGTLRAKVKELPVKTFGFKEPPYTGTFEGIQFTPDKKTILFGYDKADDTYLYLGVADKGKPVTIGRGLVKVEWRTPDLVKHYRSTPFDFFSTGEKIKTINFTKVSTDFPGTITKGERILFKASGAARLKSTGQVTRMGGIGLMETGYEGAFAFDDFIRVPDDYMFDVQSWGVGAKPSNLSLRLVKKVGESNLSKSVFLGKYTPLQPGFKEGMMIQYSNIHEIKSMDTLITLNKRSLFSSTTATASLVRQPTKQTYSIISQAFGQQAANISAQVPTFAIPSLAQTSLKTTGLGISSIVGAIGAAGIRSKQKPTVYNVSGQKQRLEPLSSLIPGIGTTSIQDQDLGTGLRDIYGVGQIGGIKQAEIEESEWKTIPGIDIGNVGMTQQDQVLGLKVGQLQSLQLMQTPTITTVTVTPITTPPVPPIIPVPIPWFGDTKKEKKKKKKKKKKGRRKKPMFEIEKMHKGLLADPLSVTRSHARYGIATHPEVTKKLWKIGEKTAYTRVPTLEMMKERKSKKRKAKKKKRGKKNVLY